MTVETVDGSGNPILRSGPYNVLAGTTSYDYEFPILLQSELTVLYENTSGVISTLVLTTDYTVTGVGNDSGGTVDLVDPASLAGGKLIILYNASFLQSTALSGQGRLSFLVLEQGLDRLVMHLRALQEQIERAAKVDNFSAVDPETLSSNINALAAIEADITAVSGIAADVSTVAGIASEVADAEANATAAAASAASAAASFDSFDDRYLGPKASNPALDNDGNALLTGSLYWNTSTNEVRVYNGASWVTAFVPSSTYAAIASNLSDLTDKAAARENLRTRMQTFRSRAEAAAVTIGTDTVVEIAGLKYKYDAAGDAFTDAGGNNFSPLDTPSPQHWTENATPGSTDMRDAVLKALQFAADRLTESNGVMGAPLEVDCLGEYMAIGSQIALTSAFDGMKLRNAYFIATGTWTATDAMFASADADSFALEDITINCDDKCSGVERAASQNSDTRVRVFRQASGGFGIKTTTKATEYIMRDCVAKQFLFGDTGWDNQNNRDADGFVMNTPDFLMEGCVAAYCRYPLYSTSGGTAQLIGNHFYNGGLVTVTGEVYAAYLDDPSQFNMVGNYFDNGALYINADVLEGSTLTSLNLSGNYFFFSSNGDNTAYIIVETSTPNSKLSGLNVVGNYFSGNLQNLVEFLTTGSGTYVADDERLWHWVGNSVSDGAMGNDTAVPYLQVSDRAHLSHAGKLNTLGGFSHAGRDLVGDLLASLSITTPAASHDIYWEGVTLDDYAHVYALIDSVLLSSSGATLQVQLSDTLASGFPRSGSSYLGGYSVNAGAASPFSSATEIPVFPNASAASTVLAGIFGQLTFRHLNLKRPCVGWNLYGGSTIAGNAAFVSGLGFWNLNNGRVDGFRLLASAGNIDQGDIKVIGVRA